MSRYSSMTCIVLALMVLVSNLLLFCGSAQAESWTKVNPRGFGDSDNKSISSMAIYNSKLYAGTSKPDQNVGCEVWRYDGGTKWTQVNKDGFGDSSNYEAHSMVIYRSKLYVGTARDAGCQVWRYNGGTSWTKVNVSGFRSTYNHCLTSMAVYNSRLYAGTYNWNKGCQVVRYDSGTSWTKVNTDGFGGLDNEGAVSMTVYNSKLYVGTEEGLNMYANGCDVWCYDGNSWTQANREGFGGGYSKVPCMASYGGRLYAGIPSYSEDGLRGCLVARYEGGTDWTQVSPSGFGSVNNWEVNSMAIYNSKLVVGTSGQSGCKVVRYDGGTSWTQINSNGFSNGKNQGARSLVVSGTKLFVGTNNSSGCEVWRGSK